MVPRSHWHRRGARRAHRCHRGGLNLAVHKEAIHMVPLLLWILGVPGLIIILLLLIGVIKI
jgi:hypothetical protein